VADGMRVGRKRVARLNAAELYGVSRRGWVITTVRDRAARRAPALVARNFTATEPDQLWVADITYIPTWAGFLYLAVVLDAFSRRVVGWAMENHLRAELVLKALDMALGQRRPRAVIHRSDQGTQYTSIAFGMRCREAGVRPSMGSVGDCFDNAMCESFFATLECELLERRRFKTQVEARMAIFDFIERWYNPSWPNCHHNRYWISLRGKVVFSRCGGVRFVLVAIYRKSVPISDLDQRRYFEA
jgi:putative transposase